VPPSFDVVLSLFDPSFGEPSGMSVWLVPPHATSAAADNAKKEILIDETYNGA
jgi:hypothetical protein